MKLKEIPSKRVFAMYTASDDHIYSVAGLNADAKKGFSDVVEVYDYRAGKFSNIHSITGIFLLIRYLK